MKKLFYNTSLSRNLKRLAKENAAEGKPLSIMEDVVFKVMLSSDTEDSREALRSLLSACTRREVSTMQILNNELLPEHLDSKISRLDVHATFNDGEVANLEMQIGKSDDDLKTRAAVYAARLLSAQPKRGKPYKETKRVYQIFFLNCVLFPDSDKLPRRYSYREEAEYDRLSEAVEIIFYEMPKLEQRVQDYLAGIAGAEVLPEDEKWCIYMKYRHEQRALPLIEELCREEAGIMRAEKVLTKVTRAERKYARDFARFKDEVDRAFAAKREFDRGVTEGEVRGEAKSKIEIARKMKSMGDSPERIQTITDLSSEEIARL